MLPSHRHATLALLALCAPRVAGWTTISQSRYGAQLDAAQLYSTVAVLAAALWFTYRYFTEVWPNREKVYVPEPWKGD